MNTFLESLDITFRRDPTNYRPRINKLNSVKVWPPASICSICCHPLVIATAPNAQCTPCEARLFVDLPTFVYRSGLTLVYSCVQDMEQKKSGNYFFMDE
jgi:hypothetical protein